MWRRWPYLIPVVYLVAILWLQPADRIVLPPIGGAEPLDYPLRGACIRWLTDDSDALAYALRAENAARGRPAGMPAEPPFFGTQWEWEDWLTTRPAVEPRYFLEYPPAALWLFRLESLGSGRSDALVVWPAVFDSHQVNVGEHAPATADERTLYRAFRHVIRANNVLMILVLLGLMALNDRRFGGAGWLLVLPGFLYFTPCRFDVLPAALVVGAVVAADRRRVALSGLCLGLAVAFKMYPLVLAPILLRYVSWNRRDAVLWCVAAATPVLLSYGGMALTDGVDGAIVPLKFQLGREPELGWCFYGKFLPEFLAAKTPLATLARTLPVLAGVLLMCARRPPDVFSLLRRCALAVLLFLTFSVFYSPQWWLWLAVLLVPLARRHPWLVGYVVAHDLWTFLHFPVLFDAAVFGGMPEPLQSWFADPRVGGACISVHVLVRAAMWAGLTVALVRAERRAVTSPASAPPAAGP